MGFGVFGSLLVLTLLFRPLICQNPNTDEFFVFQFLQKMGLNPSNDSNFSGSFCSWKGVFCDSKSENVIKLELSRLGLSGVITDTTLGKLTKIETLDLSNNKIISLPSDFWSLTSLKSLNLSLNQISGNLPSNIGNFGKLQSLDLSFNNFSGSIPESVASLLNLQGLNLSKNGFESRIPLGISQCRLLVSIDLSSNKLQGSLPKGFSAALTNLKFLNLAENEITGRDSDFSEMKSIRYLNISRNLFKGSVVGVFGGPLEVIDLSKNQFQGHILKVNFTNNFDWMNLMYLDLSENQFSGEFFPTELNHAKNLRHLNLARNRFTKQRFLKNVDMLENLVYLNLSGANLIGEIPSNISRLSRLRTLDLSYNNLTGQIPLTLLQELNKMVRFNFSYNNLSFCSSQISVKTRQEESFIGSTNSCPIAANSAYFKRKSSKNYSEVTKLAIALTLTLTCLLTAILFLAFRCRKKTRNWAVKRCSYNNEEQITTSGPFSFRTDSTTWVADVKQATSVPVIIFEKPLLNFTFADLLSATSNFDSGTLLAEGRFGPVYGGLLPGGAHIAVKVLLHGSTITDSEAAKEFENLGRIKHPNLVPLTGYCLAGEQRIAIYEYMENGNLQNLLYDLPLGAPATGDWSTEDNNHGIQEVDFLSTWRFRHKIALGTARALAFLHHGCSPPMIHSNVRASSVYLDSNLEPRLSDFGLAKIFGNGVEDEINHGSNGCFPPENEMTPKSDVYGFGVILFQLITGKKAVDDDYYLNEKEANLVSWVRGLVRRNRVSEAIDPKVEGSDLKILEALKIGYLCTAEVPSKRPSMQQVVGLLKDLEPLSSEISGI